MNESGQRQPVVYRLMLIFGLIYIVDGLVQSPLLTQPLMNFLKTQLGWGPDKTAAYISFLVIPWMVKPIYGMFSDFVPLFGYRRKSYIFIANALASVALLSAYLVSEPARLSFLFLTASFGIAVSTTLGCALMVENGKKLSMSGIFVNMQYMCFFGANLGAAVLGGWIAQNYGAVDGMHTAMLILGLSPLIVIVGLLFINVEEKSQLNLAGLKATFSAVVSTLKSRTFWMAALFIFFYMFSPGFGTPLYYHMVDHLHFSQQFIGNLAAIGAIGSVIGGNIYPYLQKRMTLKQLMITCIILGAASQASYLLLNSQTMAIVLAVINGAFGMITLVAMLALAAEYCPDGAEGFTFAMLMSIHNLTLQASSNVGAQMYVRVFHSQLNPLIISSAVITLFGLLLIPLLKLGNKKAGEK